MCFFFSFSVILTRSEKRVKPSSLSPMMRDAAGGRQLALNQSRVNPEPTPRSEPFTWMWRGPECQLLLLPCDPVPGAHAPRPGSLGWRRGPVLDKTGAKHPSGWHRCVLAQETRVFPSGWLQSWSQVSEAFLSALYFCDPCSFQPQARDVH